MIFLPSPTRLDWGGEVERERSISCFVPAMLVVLKIDVIALIKSQYKVDKTQPYSYFV